MSDTLGVSTGQDDGDGSEERFAEFYRSEYPRSVRLAFSLIGSIESAEDVVQEMFSRLGTRFLDLDNPGAYLRIGIIHGCQDAWQKRKLAVEHAPQSGVHVQAASSAELFDVLLKLPYRQRAVLVLRYWADWTEADIADVLGCRPGAVKSLASRGLARLRREITP